MERIGDALSYSRYKQQQKLGSYPTASPQRTPFCRVYKRGGGGIGHVRLFRPPCDATQRRLSFGICYPAPLQRIPLLHRAKSSSPPQPMLYPSAQVPRCVCYWAKGVLEGYQWTLTPPLVSSSACF